MGKNCSIPYNTKLSNANRKKGGDKKIRNNSPFYRMRIKLKKDML